MVLPYSIALSNFRSFETEVQIPFSKKVTIVAGPNNTGKSNVLRALAILLNRAGNSLDNDHDFDGPDKVLKSRLVFTDEYANSKFNATPHLLAAYGRGKMRVQGDLIFSKDRTVFSIDRGKLSPHMRDYINSQHEVLSDFSSSGSDNIGHIEGRLDPTGELPGTSYVPNIRFITETGAEPPQFNKHGFPGQVVAFGGVINDLAELDRPSEKVAQRRQQFRQLQDFMAYALDVPNVSIQVPTNRTTILVSVDGDERRLGNLGTGVEQLLIIGLASVAFPGKVVLIDEPELHLHPTSQRRLITYLSQNIEADFVIATHSAAIMDAVEADIIHISRSKTGEKTTRTIMNGHERHLAVRDLGHLPSDLVQTRFAIWVEGPSDRVYLNYWLHCIDPELVEGIDYTILLYGGSVLAQHSFTDDTVDLVKALSLSRSFAVVIDSDRHPDKPRLRPAKARVQEEVERQGGLCWVTAGREIENYVSEAVISKLAGEFSWVSIPTEKHAQVLDPAKANKAKFARRATELFDDEWPLDLKQRVTSLVEEIRKAGPSV